MTIGERIKSVRKLCGEKGVTQKELGAMCGIDAANIRKYESNRQNPKIETVTKIAHALDVPVSLLMGEQPFPDPFLEEPKALISVCKAVNDHHHTKISDLPFVEKIRIIEGLVAEINFWPDPNVSMDEIAASVVIFKEYHVLATEVVSKFDASKSRKDILIEKISMLSESKLEILENLLDAMLENTTDNAASEE